jgi:hypothetical protein
MNESRTTLDIVRYTTSSTFVSNVKVCGCPRVLAVRICGIGLQIDIGTCYGSASEKGKCSRCCDYGFEH